MDKIINIAVVAHVDAGKSTLVDALLEQNGVFNEHEEIKERVMDSIDIKTIKLILLILQDMLIFLVKLKEL